jgi:hypothetical protein
MTESEFDSLMSIAEAAMRYAKFRDIFGRLDSPRARHAAWYIGDYVSERLACGA